MAGEEKHRVPSESGEGTFFPELPRMRFQDLLNEEILIEDAKLIKDFEGNFGKKDLVIWKFKWGEKEATTACSAMVVVKKISQVIALKDFPIWGKLIKTVKGYYDII